MCRQPEKCYHAWIMQARERPTSNKEGGGFEVSCHFSLQERCGSSHGMGYSSLEIVPSNSNP